MHRTTFGATGTDDLIGTADAFFSGEVLLHVSGTFVGTVQTKGYLPGNGLALSDRQPIPYSGKAGTLTDPTVTGITTTGLYVVPLRAGERLVLECTAWTSGTILIDVQPSLTAG